MAKKMMDPMKAPGIPPVPSSQSGPSKTSPPNFAGPMAGAGAPPMPPAFKSGTKPGSFVHDGTGMIKRRTIKTDGK